jgi:hypothetical protein
VGFRIVAANKKPDHATIARFRRKNLRELEELFPAPSSAGLPSGALTRPARRY